jgi:hypothetical protein
MADGIGRRILGLLGALGLAGCDGPVVQTLFMRSVGNWSELVYASTDGPLFVEILGEPFQGGREELAQAVTRAMANALAERKTDFTTDAKAAPHPNYRVRMAFQPPKTLSGRDLCSGEPFRPAPPEADKLTVTMVFCAREQMLSEVRGWARKIDSPQNPRLAELIGHATRALFSRDGR